MNLALVHDCIANKGGAERVLLNMHKAFPDATIFTSVYDEKNTYPEFENCDIETTWIQRITADENFFKKTFMIFGLWAMQSHDLSGYDVILMSSTNCAKYVKTNENNFVVNFCHTPFRLAWDPNSYTLYESAKGYKKYLLDKFFSIIFFEASFTLIDNLLSKNFPIIGSFDIVDGFSDSILVFIAPIIIDLHLIL